VKKNAMGRLPWLCRRLHAGSLGKKNAPIESIGQAKSLCHAQAKGLLLLVRVHQGMNALDAAHKTTF
jgi:hypothetical protein